MWAVWGTEDIGGRTDGICISDIEGGESARKGREEEKDKAKDGQKERGDGAK